MSNLKLAAPVALTRSDRKYTSPGADWQRLWLASRSRPWRSLAVVPAGPGAPAELTWRVAVMLARTGEVHLNCPIHVADATRLTLAELIPFSEEVEYYTRRQEIILVALPALSENVTAMQLAQGADAALLVVLLRHMSIAHGKQTVESVGAQRFVGSALLRAPGA
jgi:hypothetical protein